jgi:hypothetical protein
VNEIKKCNVVIGHDEKTKQSIVCTNEAIATYKCVIKDVHVCEQHNRYFQDQIKEQKEYERKKYI